MNIPCPVCAGAARICFKQVSDTLHWIAGSWNLYTCTVCTASFLADPPDASAIQKYYPASAYYTHRDPPDDVRVLAGIYDYFYGVDRSAGNALLYFLLRGCINMFPEKNKSGPTRLLDYGCGNGMLLKRFGKYGFSCEGYDVDSEALKGAVKLGVPVYTGNELLSIEEKRYDVIIMNQVVEHLHDPIKTLRFLRDLTAPDGRLIISTPNAHCIDFSILRDAWYAFQAPTHLFHFNEKSLRTLLGKAGYRVYRTAHSSALATLRPAYILDNLYKLFRRRGKSAGSLACAAQFFLATGLSLLPFANRLKQARITVYARRV